LTSTPGSAPSRPPLDDYFMEIAEIVSKRSTCRHRHQGVVLARDKRIISTGYNGSAPGQTHCIDTDCLKDLGGNCRAEGLHGESNAIASAALMGVSTKGATAYCLYSPCLACCNLLKSAGIVKVVYREAYEGYPGGPFYLEQTLGMEVLRREKAS